MVINRMAKPRPFQDNASLEEKLALFKLLALGNQDVEAGRAKPARAVIERLRSKDSRR
jgi:hypothetical protein